MSTERFSQEFLDLCRSVTLKRPKTVIEHILTHGQITTEELKVIYGYSHPPRAAQDVKDHGIPIKRITVIGSDGRKIAAYRFGDHAAPKMRRFSGRTALSKRIKKELLERYGCRCSIYLETLPEADLQIDHRVPYGIGGESETMSTEDFMLLCRSANRAKSWSCEHCENWRNLKKREVCLSCYWANPENYTHVGMLQLRRVDLMWEGAETDHYERLKSDAASARMPIPEFVKEILRKSLTSESSLGTPGEIPPAV